MPPTDLTPPEVRVLGCLIEKHQTTPDHYPLSLNALRSACNQSTNRDPVTSYDADSVHEAARSLIARRWARSASGHGGRTLKYRHLLADALGIDLPIQAMLAVLMLRGPQTPGELKQRTARMYDFRAMGAVLAKLEELIGGGFVRQLPRQPGQKEERYIQLLDSDSADATVAAGGGEAVEPPPARGTEDGSIEQRLQRLEREVAELKLRLDAAR